MRHFRVDMSILLHVKMSAMSAMESLGRLYKNKFWVTPVQAIFVRT